MTTIHQPNDGHAECESHPDPDCDHGTTTTMDHEGHTWIGCWDCDALIRYIGPGVLDSEGNPMPEER